MSKEYRVVSADSHLEVSTDRWMHRVPEKYRDRAPRRIRLASGGDAHIVEELWQDGHYIAEPKFDGG